MFAVSFTIIFIRNHQCVEYDLATGKINTVFAQVGLTLDGVERNHDQIVDAIWATLQQSGEVKSQTQPPTSSDQGFTEPKPKSKDRRIDYKALTAIAEDGFLLVGMGGAVVLGLVQQMAHLRGAQYQKPGALTIFAMPTKRETRIRGNILAKCVATFSKDHAPSLPELAPGAIAAKFCSSRSSIIPVGRLWALASHTAPTQLASGVLPASTGAAPLAECFGIRPMVVSADGQLLTLRS